MSPTYRVDGSEQTGTSVYGLSGFGRWDASGTIMEVAEARYSEGSSGVNIAGYALMAVSDR